MLFSWLTEKGVLAMNPAREVKTERFSRTEGKTPAFVEGEVQKGVLTTSNRYSVNGILQSIFRSASRREALGKHSKGRRRDAGLKMDWTKPLPRAWPMCIECRLDLG
jgi:hypothetical protein